MFGILLNPKCGTAMAAMGQPEGDKWVSPLQLDSGECIPLLKRRRKEEFNGTCRGVWKGKQHNQELIDQIFCNEITRLGCPTPQKYLFGNKQRIFLGVGTVSWKWV